MSRSPRSQIPKGGIRNPKYLHPAAPQPNRLAHPPNRDGIPNPIASPKPNRSHQNRARILSFPPSPSPPTNRTAGRIEPATLRAQPINQTRMTETGRTPERARVEDEHEPAAMARAARLLVLLDQAAGLAAVSPSRLLRPSARGKRRRGIQPS